LEIETALINRLRQSAVRVLERHQVTRLLTDATGRCVGVEAGDGDTGRMHRITATATILASGGAGRLWRQSTNPDAATGDGVALAYEAGAEVAGMEFVQFHPTALALSGAPRFLISEAVRGEGAHVVNARGERFLFDSDPRGELAPRDVVAQAIWSELRHSGEGSVFLDCSPLADRAAVRFPTIYKTCLSFGLDIRNQPIPIAPAAHYLIGGVRTDLSGATNVDGLYACGEVASSGVHGANRLASNSLLESVVFAHRAVAAALERGAEAAPPALDGAADAPRGDGGAAEPDTRMLGERLRTAMWDGAGVVRDQPGLRRSLDVIKEIAAACEDRASAAARSLHACATTATLVCTAALAREESRGSHLRSDHPGSSDDWLGTWIMQKKQGARFDRHDRSHD
jgi:L-aspartate oxidase